MKTVRLFCFPHAGGSSTYYKHWSKYVDSSIIFHPVELAGRGNRFNEPYYYSMEQAVDDIYSIVYRALEDNPSPFAFFGHSMGSLLAFNLTRKMQKKNLTLPTHLFLSGRVPPHRKNNRMYHQLPNTEFWKKVGLMGGIPKEVVKNEELMNLFLPLLKSDFKVVETYEYKEGEALECPLSIFYSNKDSYTPFEMFEWNRYSTVSCNYYDFDGEHFFIQNHAENICKIMNNELTISISKR